MDERKEVVRCLRQEMCIRDSMGVLWCSEILDFFVHKYLRSVRTGSSLQNVQKIRMIEYDDE